MREAGLIVDVVGDRDSGRRPDATRRGLVLVPLLVFAATRAHLAIGLERPHTDVRLYFMYAVQGVDLDYEVYRDFSVEYPPLAYWLMAAPRAARHFTVAEVDPDGVAADRGVSTRTHAVTQLPAGERPHDRERFLDEEHLVGEYARYVRAYRAALLVADGAVFLLLLFLLRRRGLGGPELAASLCAYAGATFFLGHVLWDRLDLAVSLLVVACLALWHVAVRRDARRPAYAALALCGAGVALKLFTLVMAPFLVLGLLRRFGLRTAAFGAATFSLFAAAPFLVHAASSGAEVFSFLEYHRERPIQIESVYASLQAGLAPFGLELSLGYSHGSTNLSSALSPVLLPASTVALLVALAGLGALALARQRALDQAPRFAGVALLATIALSKVLSVQFFIIVLPVLLVLTADSGVHWLRRGGPAIAAVLGLLSGAIFPYLWNANTEHFPGLGPFSLSPGLHWLPLTLLFVRNLLFCAVVAALAWELVRGPKVPTP